MKFLVLFICLCISLANAKPYTPQPIIGTHFVYVNPTQGTNQVIPTFRTVATPFSTGPVATPYKTVPVATPYTTVPVATPYSTFPYVFNRFHTQDRTGAYTFAYSGGPSSRTETRDRFGNVVGAFNYVDPEGKIQTQQYVADSTGFRVAGTNLPVEPVVKLSETENIKETVPTRTKRETTVGKTPASTVPLKTFPIQQIVPQTYSTVITPQVFPTGITPQIFPNVFTNVIPNVYTASKTPVTSFPYNVFPTFYTVPSVVPTIDTKTSETEKIKTTPFTQPIVYSGVTNPYYTYDPNFFTRQANTQKTPNTGFTFYY